MGLFSAIFYAVAVLAFVSSIGAAGFLSVGAMITGAAFLISGSVLAAGALLRAAIRKLGESKTAAAAADTRAAAGSTA